MAKLFMFGCDVDAVEEAFSDAADQASSRSQSISRSAEDIALYDEPTSGLVHAHPEFRDKTAFGGKDLDLTREAGSALIPSESIKAWSF